MLLRPRPGRDVATSSSISSSLFRRIAISSVASGSCSVSQRIVFQTSMYSVIAYATGGSWSGGCSRSWRRRRCLANASNCWGEPSGSSAGSSGHSSPNMVGVAVGVVLDVEREVRHHPIEELGHGLHLSSSNPNYGIRPYKMKINNKKRAPRWLRALRFLFYLTSTTTGKPHNLLRTQLNT